SRKKSPMGWDSRSATRWWSMCSAATSGRASPICVACIGKAWGSISCWYSRPEPLPARRASALALVAAVLVLGGALAAGHRYRVYDAVVLKTLGATRGQLIGAYAL